MKRDWVAEILERLEIGYGGAPNLLNLPKSLISHASTLSRFTLHVFNALRCKDLVLDILLCVGLGLVQNRLNIGALNEGFLPGLIEGGANSR